MYLKMMDGYDQSDSDPRKTFTIFDDVTSVNFNIIDGKPTVYVCFRTGGDERYDVHGNVYVMNDTGKTIATYSCP